MDMRVEEQHERALDAPGGQYETAQYPSMPYAFTQPEQLAALASLFGVPAPAAEGARVLELGCAAGGNILPMAARHPSARFVGIDLSQAHIEEGRRRSEALGLKNVDLRQGDLARVQLDGEQFDYIVCHGVYSWVPQDVQESILRICQECLAPDGMALISYNVLPGWHLRQVARDACRRYTGKSGSPFARAARAREVLQRLAYGASDTELYGKLLRNEARRAPQRPASYMLSELLDDPNEPCYFEDFAARVQAHELAYLCEADLAASTPEIFNPGVVESLDGLGGTGNIEFEQAVDYLTGRTFRRSVLVRARAGREPAQQASAERLRSLYFTAAFRVEQDDEHGTRFVDRRGRTIAAKEPAIAGMLAHLAKAYPDSASFCDLSAAAAAPEASEEEKATCRALMLLVNVGQVEVSTMPLKAGKADSRHPRAWWFAREEASLRQPWVTTLRHDAVRLHPVMSFLLPRLDGHHDREMLTARLEEALALGLLQLPDTEGRSPGHHPGQARKDAEQYVDAVLRYLAAHALLEQEAP